MRSSLLVQVVRCRGRINCMTDKAWSVLMPVKVLAEAKSRLAGLAGLTGPRRAELALALASDTVTAVLGSDAVARVIVITDDQAGAAALGALGALVVADEARAVGPGGAARRAERGAAARRRLCRRPLARRRDGRAVRRPARAAARADRPGPARRRRLAHGPPGRRGRRRHDAVHRGAGGGVPARVRPGLARPARRGRRRRTPPGPAPPG